MKVSVVTIVKNRKPALINMILGLSRGSVLPDELVIVHMNEGKYDLQSETIKILEYQLQSNNSLPLAEARNFAIQHANNKYVIFLDADCIPDVTLVQDYITAFKKSDILWSGRVRYLTKDVMNNDDLLTKLHDYSLPDKVREKHSNFSYELFWSLNFGCSKTVFNTVGGFDENYKGYGAEDTDFSFSARKNNVELGTINAMAYHQYHPSYDPPLNHLEDIISNALTFKQKWNVFPMEGWLKKFHDLGFIDYDYEGIKLHRIPSKTEIEQCIKLT
jgi:glycosyltransferase involved in cell wall biosynthesis